MTSRFTFLLVLILLANIANIISCKNPNINIKQHDDNFTKNVQMARSEILHAMERAHQGLTKSKTLVDHDHHDSSSAAAVAALSDCFKLYEDSELRLARLVNNDIINSADHDDQYVYSNDDAVTWVSAAMASHRSCLDGLEEKGLFFLLETHNLTLLLQDALASFTQQPNITRPISKGAPMRESTRQAGRGGLLASWNRATSKADVVVAQDGSGNYRTINEAVAALARMGQNRPNRAVVHVKSGVYHEKVEIRRDLKNVMFVGDGMDNTIVTGNQNVEDGATTFTSATFGVSGDGFWARDMTFQNTAGPGKNQAVALRVGSDLSIFYRCSFKGYQDTLLVHSLRQFYRDCQIYGTVDFIFGDASAVFQNCDIFVRRPMDHQSNMITAQGRDNPHENTGISIVNCRVRPSPEFASVKGRFKSYLGRPWKKYSRTVIMKTDLDGLVDPRGWREWNGDFALSTLYYGEYVNTGIGASTSNRVKWAGFRVMHDLHETIPFSVRNFIQGDYWIPAAGVPYWAEI